MAEGLLRAGEKLGHEAKAHFANEVSGVGDGATYSAREYLMNGLLYALEPRQPIAMLHEISWFTGLWVMNQADPNLRRLHPRSFGLRPTNILGKREGVGSE